MDHKELKIKLQSSLKELGLSALEMNLYVISLSIGPSSIANIAKHLGISRPNVYKVIEGLEKHGLAKFAEKGKFSRNFVVESPTVLLEKVRQKREEVAKLDQDLASQMPDLLAMYHQGATPTKVKLLHGKDQYLKIFNQSLEESQGEIQYFGVADELIDFISWQTDRKLNNSRIKKEISVKMLLLPGENTEKLKAKDALEKRETRILSGATPFVTSFQLFANKVVIWQPKAQVAVLVEDQFIVQMLKSMFDLLWQNSKNNEEKKDVSIDNQPNNKPKES